jgi:hypothetical protein
MSLSDPPLKSSRYFDNGSPTRCHYCGGRFEGSAIRDSKSNRYFSYDACLGAAQLTPWLSKIHLKKAGLEQPAERADPTRGAENIFRERRYLSTSQDRCLPKKRVVIYPLGQEVSYVGA